MQITIFNHFQDIKLYSVAALQVQSKYPTQRSVYFPINSIYGKLYNRKYYDYGTHIQ